MLLARANSRSARRRGAILLIVMTLIALFSVIGLSFAIYAESEALGSRIRREAVATSDDPPSVQAAASAALGLMLFPGMNDVGATYGTGNTILKTIRGHDHATLVFGDNPNGGNNIPYNGVGTFQEILTGVPTATGTIPALDRRNVVNYSLQAPRDAAGNLVPTALHVIDPSFTGFRDSTQLGISPANAATFPTKAYIARNAPYTYPDRLNMQVAMQDPSTGRVIIPSFHRPSLFITTPTPPPGLSELTNLSPLNPNWRDQNSFLTGFGAVAGDPTGRYKILRPRPWDHRLPGETEDQSQFPFPTQNPDGTWTGDVQNITQVDGQQRNDSVWIDMGLPIRQWRGKNMVPLVAATILPLDGRVNVNVAGNTKNSGNHGSMHGFGPWEIGLSRITTDATTMVNARATLTNLSPRGTNVTSLPFAPNVTQSYTAVNWDAGTTTAPLTLPTGIPPNQYSSDPSYGTSGFGSDNTANATTEADRHPGLLNPFSWNSFTSGAVLFPHTDLRRASVKYAGKPLDYNAPFFGTTPPATLTGTGAGNASNSRRPLLTTASSSLARPGLSPNFADYLTAPLQLNAAGQLVFVQPTLTNPVIPGATSNDFGGATNLRNAMAALGPVNLNRPLADYRAATGATGALSPTNFLNYQNATNDRQTLARDIFVRLIVATGAKAVVNPTAGTLVLPRPGATPGTYDLIAPGDTLPEQYNALRYLAQLAANIVDTIDNDDVATQFVWNPITASSLFGPDNSHVELNTYFLDPATTQPMRDAYTADRIVFGVEKPRAVINEVYAELVNDPADMLNVLGNATTNYHARFWIELLNPGNTQDAASALGDGSVKVRYDVADGVAAAYSPYRLRVYRSMDAGTVATNLNAQNNPAGDPSLPTATTPAIDRNFSETDGALATRRTITPNNGAATSTTLNAGFAVFGPEVNPGEMGSVFNPNSDITMPPAVITSPMNGHFTQMLDSAGNTNAVTNNAVLLQRLACPYLPPGPTNPYISVDFFQNVTAHDVVRRANDSVADRNPTFGRSSGRIEPFFGRSTLNVPQGMADMMRHHSLFQHNNNQGAPLATPFKWLVHFDRPLVNQTELQMAAACRNQELTQLFADATGANAHQHVASFGSPTLPLYRALELLSVKPWGYGMATEGRVPGKININMIWDQRVLEALLDQNAANSFSTTDVSTVWQMLQGSASDTSDMNYRSFTRTKAPGTVGPTVDEVGATYVDGTGITRGADRPFKPFGTPSFAAGGFLPSGSGLADTLLRDGATPNTPAIFAAAPAAPAVPHPYQRSEMLRKMFNNVTTTSDTYLVVMTVSYFEVRNPNLNISPTNPIVLGKEVFNQTTGDLRGKFVAIVDRSMMGVDATNQHVDKMWQAPISEAPYDPTITPGPAANIWYVRFPAQGTRLGGIQMLYEGQEAILTNGSAIYLGAGPNAELVTIQAVGGRNPDGSVAPAFDPATGLATITLTAPPGRLHHPGSLASNAIAMYPGPQPNFDVNSTRYRGVVPYFEQVEIGK